MKLKRFYDEDYFPLSACIKLDITFSDAAKRLCPSKTTITIDDGPKAVLSAQNELRAAIKAAAEVDILAKKRQLLTKLN